MKVYVVMYHDFEYDDFGPVMRHREHAEALAAGLGDNWTVEAFDVLEKPPIRVRMYWAQKHTDGTIAQGDREYWDYSLPPSRPNAWVAWAQTPTEAVALLAAS